MQTFKDILVFIWAALQIAVFATAIIATIKGWDFTAFFAWLIVMALCFLHLPTDGGMGSYDSDF